MSFFAALKNFPRFAYHVVKGVAVSIFTEPETFLLSLAAILVGLAIGAAWALALFFSIYVFIRFAGQFVGGLARELHFIGAVLRDREFEVTVKEEPPPPMEVKSIFPPTISPEDL